MMVLSGGVESRLWPLSREAHPKPKIGDGRSLLQKTYKRAAIVSKSDEILTVTNRNLFFTQETSSKNLASPLKEHVPAGACWAQFSGCYCSGCVICS